MPKVQKAVHIRKDSTLSASSMRHGEKVDDQHPHHISSLWRDGQDETLLKARSKGLGWQEIATQHFPHKTANACRKRHERLMERRNQDEWDHARLEELGAAYMACRKEMWSVLADRLEDRWTNVEAKCLEKGFKTLQKYARTSGKKSLRTEPHASVRGGDHHEGDSAVGLSDAEVEARRCRETTSTTTSTIQEPPRLLVPPPADLLHLFRAQARPRSRPPLLDIPLYQPPVTVALNKQHPSRLALGAAECTKERPQTTGPRAHRRSIISIPSLLSPFESPIR